MDAHPSHAPAAFPEGMVASALSEEVLAPHVVRPRTWLQKPGPAWRSQLTPNPTVPLGRKGREEGKRGSRRSFFCGMGLLSRVRLNLVGVQLEWRVQPEAGGSSQGRGSAWVGELNLAFNFKESRVFFIHWPLG